MSSPLATTPAAAPAQPTTTPPATTLPPVDLHNIQGDIFPGLPKKFEAYWFIQIRDGQVNQFRTKLFKLLPLITSAAQAQRDQDQIDHYKGSPAFNGQLLKLSGVNIGFSHKGLVKLGIADPITNTTTDPFQTGMFNDISNLNDQADKWLPDFKKDIHALIFITGESLATIHERYAELKWILGSTIQEVKLTVGNVRPGKENGHEHFGYLDGVSQPNIQGIDKSPDPNPVEAPIPQGLILCKRDGDVIGTSTDPFPRPDWALDGSFMAFRYLTQNVPEFQAFIDAKNPPGAPQDFLGARLVGRWKSGAPIDLTPLHDDPALAADPIKINHFTFDAQSQERCPFAAHIRKTNPRGDFPPDVAEKRRILRRGIPFGPEVSPVEKQNQKTVLDRGLLFKCYQSQIGVGFQFLQQSWANNTKFPFGRTKIPTPGFDAIIGQDPNGGDRAMDISATNDPNSSLDLPVEWVISKGGEYFFSPSISALREVFALNPFVNGNGVHHENGNGLNGVHHPEL